MKDHVSTWRQEHVRFNRLLDLVESQLDRFHLGIRPDYTRILEAMRYMRQYADTIHHPREDLAFARLAKRDPRCRLEIEALIGEHDEITHSGEELVLLLDEVLDGAFVERAQVEKPGREYLRLVREHIRREERFFPAVNLALSARDWEDIDREIPEQPDPLPELLAQIGEVA
jgi:hemerythrin-like domain-containing protein